MPPGGNSDTVARVLAPRMAEVLGQPLVVENRAGAGGSVGATQLARARPDGYNLLLGSNGPMTVNPNVQANLAYDPLRDFTPIGLAVRTPLTITVHRSLPPRSVAELIAYAKARPGQVGIGSSGVASISHLALEVFNAMTGAGLLHVPYGSGGALTPDLVAGTVGGAFTEISTALPLHRDGAVRILGLSAARRLALAPEIPTVEEGGVPGYRAAAFIGILLPAGAPPEVTGPLQAALAAAVADAGVRRRLEEMGSEMAAPEEATPAGFAAFLQAETEWTRAAAERAGLRP
ncbi:tripartite tricarboxylate transporter substrate binding protein [Siccirubricoccus sp. G192]|uniref:Bug family tripartite tricarboxylate transporter substrate binding protein n=1 Tax=Siccirubricoccus sp. G192 TaxID=2849651 RepID=UPI001C2B907E|nr:tripartite tricarboxylate transporter substrate binding protein [Siccirubricoccus sp. G192]MBV1797285.1 tripartite tricarboxylate transporter substrate binding protein [Siccirubricoccus sp. G192]